MPLTMKEVKELEKLYDEVNKGTAKPSMFITPEGYHTKDGFFPFDDDTKELIYGKK